MDDPKDAFARLLADFQVREGLDRDGLRIRLGVGRAILQAWLNARKLPSKKYWDRLVTAGVATKDQLRGFHAAMPKKYTLRGARVYDLETYANMPAEKRSS